MAKRYRHKEHFEQAAYVAWFRHQYPLFTDFLFAIPNGAHLAGSKTARIKQISKLKKEGFKNGVSDLLLALPNAYFYALWLEMKDTGKTQCSVSEDQQRHLLLMQAVNYKALWCAGADEAITVTKKYMASVNVDTALIKSIMEQKQ